MASYHAKQFIQAVLVTAFAYLLAPSAAASRNVVTIKHVKVGERGFIVARDNVLSSASIQDLRTLVQERSTWRHIGEGEREPLATDVRSGYERSGWPWLTHLNVSRIRSSGVGNTLLGLVEELAGRDGFNVDDATGYMLRRGDDSRITEGASASADDHTDVYVHIELSSAPWKKNDYGETLFYSPTAHASSGIHEMLEAVHLKPNRVIAWSGDVPFALRPPSMNNAQWRCGLVVRFSTDDERVQQSASIHQKSETAMKEGERGEFPAGACSEDSSNLQSEESLTEKLTRKFRDSRGKPVAVFDNVWTADQVSGLRRHLLSSHPQFQPLLKFQAADERADNGRWAAEFEGSRFVKTCYSNVARMLASVVSKAQGWFPVRVALESLQSADDVHIHRNCEKEEEEYTMLLYLNDHYADNSHGETVFFEPAEPPQSRPKRDEEEEGYEDEGEEEQQSDSEEEDAFEKSGKTPVRVAYDIIGGVQPRSGRVVVFHSSIPHSTRPPRADIRVIHYTFTVRMSSTEQIAKSKLILQILKDKAAASTAAASVERNTATLHATLTKGLENARQQEAGDGGFPDIAALDALIKIERDSLTSAREESLRELFDRL